VTFTGRRVLVTGGSRGIGRATVVALATAGHPVAFCYSSDEAGARETQQTAEAVGGKALAVRRVTENQGRRTPGVDGIAWCTPEEKRQTGAWCPMAR